jgi:hypothetical protein
MKLKVSKTVLPPKQPSLIKWMQDFKVGVRIEMKSNNRAEEMNQFYDIQKIKL